MPTRNYKPEQIVGVLRQIEVQIASGHAAGLQGSGDLHADLLPVAEGIGRVET